MTVSIPLVFFVHLPFAEIGMNLRYADKIDLGYSHLADAAFIRRRGILIAAEQCMSSYRSLTVALIAQSETELSPQLNPKT